ncbi:MAG: hypothetical protein J3R72DRAFT_516632 [Linnemannia gamsii]|nr:MAG: hypothetical protein J3R72DRAFT_516632 [Linnemannia gamsii]
MARRSFDALFSLSLSLSRSIALSFEQARDNERWVNEFTHFNYFAKSASRLGCQSGDFLQLKFEVDDRLTMKERKSQIEIERPDPGHKGNNRFNNTDYDDDEDSFVSYGDDDDYERTRK